MAVGKASSGSGKNIASTSNTSGKASSVSTGKNVSTNGNVGKANSSGLGKNINPSAGTAGKAINTTGKKNVVPNSMMDIATPPAINPVPGSAPSGVVAVELTPKQRRMQGLTAVRNDFDNGIVYTYLTKQLLASDLTVEQGNIIAKALAISPIYLEQLPFNAAYTVSKFKNIAEDGPPNSYVDVKIDIATQKLLLSSGINSVNGIPIPKNTADPMSIGLQKQSAKIYGGDSPFTKIGEGTGMDGKPEQKMMVTTRVPDAFDYNYSKNQHLDDIPEEHKGHAQFQKPYDNTLESDLAAARYLSGVIPYLDSHRSKEFDHFTYWRYKQININNIFRGAYVHIFISRPDLHIFDRGQIGELSLRADLMNDTDMASLVYMSPEIAMSLVQKWQTGATSDINLFLSNRACGISLDNEVVDDHQFVEGFNKITPVFGGRADNPAGQLDIIFNETQDLSVDNTMLMWMKYIHLTYTGKVSALLNPNSDGDFNEGAFYKYHPIWRRLDSLASIYVIATDMTQTNIIFWRKYFGVYPKNTAFAGLSKQQGQGLSEGIRTAQIPFRYTTFRTNNIIDLYAFNRLSDLHSAFAKGYQTHDPLTANDYNNIAGLPFIWLEQNLSSEFDSNFRKTIPPKMYNPQLRFTRTDGGFIPSTGLEFQRNFVEKYWGDLGGSARYWGVRFDKPITE